MNRLLAVMILAAAPVPAADAPDPVVLPGVVSTAASEIRLAIRPDGRQMLWGAIGRDAARGQLDIWERHRVGDGWSAPAPVSFNTDAEDFDPAFARDGRQLYFHSARPGGFGGTDIYVVDVDAAGGFGAPRNLGPRINSKGDEWAPTPLAGGRLLFASDGWGGFGRHDLFVAGPKDAKPRNLGPAINGPQEDFDGAVSADGRTLVFSSGVMSDEEAKVGVFVSRMGARGWAPRRPLGVGCSAFVNGLSFDPADGRRLFYSAACPGGPGRMDLREARLPAG